MTREEAVSLLDSVLHMRSRGYYTHLQFGGKQDKAEEEFLDSLDMAIAALRKQGDKDTNVPIKWIPVQEKLPERGQSVLILCKNKAMFTGYQLPDYSGEARWRIHTALNSARLLNRGRVTHWMPLPDVPEVEV